MANKLRGRHESWEEWRKAISPMTTWHRQSGLLWISWTWGASYVVPERDRVPFAEVFPHVLASALLPMWGWGLILLVAATCALIAEQLLRHTHLRPWSLAWGGHIVLAGTYGTLAVAALAQAVMEISGSPLHFHFWGGVISAASRTVLWGMVAFFHSTYARIGRIPEVPERIPQ